MLFNRCFVCIITVRVTFIIDTMGLYISDTCIRLLLIQNLYGNSQALCQSMSVKLLFQKAFPLGLIFLFFNRVHYGCVFCYTYDP